MPQSDRPTRTALVTGSSRGLGRKIAIELASSGYDLALTARSATDLADTARQARSLGARVVTVPGDISRREEVARTYRAVRHQLGPINVLINNAGCFGGFDSFADTDPQRWWQVLETNLKGPALLTHHVLPDMLASRSGHIVNINSRAATHDYLKRSGSAYGVSKAALMRLTHALAGELAGTGVVVFDFSPGIVRTAMTQQYPHYEGIPDRAFSPISAVAVKVRELVSGQYDRLHGKFLHFRDDVDAMLAQIDDSAATLAAGGLERPLTDRA